MFRFLCFGGSQAGHLNPCRACDSGALEAEVPSSAFIGKFDLKP